MTQRAARLAIACIFPGPARPAMPRPARKTSVMAATYRVSDRVHEGLER